MLLKIRTMATNFSPCKGSYVLNQFPSNVMFGMNGFQPVERDRAIMALLFFSWDCPWARHFRAQPSTGETQERHE